MHTTKTLQKAALLVLIAIFPCAFKTLAEIAASSSQAEAPQLTDHKIPAFEVVSIHQVSPQEINMGGVALRMTSFRFTDDGFQALNASLESLLISAYHINSTRLKDLPAWATEHDTAFNITAKVDEADVPAFKQLSNEGRAAMLRKLLEDRFHLVVHRETKDGPSYSMVIAKGGTKLKEAEQSPSASGAGASAGKAIAPSIMPGPYEIKSHGGSMSSFAAALEDRLHEPVLNQTGLTGRYDFVLSWKPEDQASAQSGDNHEAIFSAIREQLGLALQPTRAPVEFLYVDHVEKPSAN